ncbi:hypothetical protein OH76DRAFT_1192753 [Lentinus brumalis]|uniref:Uncharacterized protein n=1 Tax=Lentinus brumalis TaxID=2498619 RepID=A0A371CTN1_9APHY|nr:hypothetical protein OH76DRAFT_1192753 [Polyporus brumalis]
MDIAAQRPARRATVCCAGSQSSCNRLQDSKVSSRSSRPATHSFMDSIECRTIGQHTRTVQNLTLSLQAARDTPELSTAVRTQSATTKQATLGPRAHEQFKTSRHGILQRREYNVPTRDRNRTPSRLCTRLLRPQGRPACNDRSPTISLESPPSGRSLVATVEETWTYGGAVSKTRYDARRAQTDRTCTGSASTPACSSRAPELPTARRSASKVIEQAPPSGSGSGGERAMHRRRCMYLKWCSVPRDLALPTSRWRSAELCFAPGPTVAHVRHAARRPFLQHRVRPRTERTVCSRGLEPEDMDAPCTASARRTVARGARPGSGERTVLVLSTTSGP